MEVHFYLPEKYLPDSARREAWKEGKITTLEQGGKIASAQSWVYQTALRLEEAGWPVQLTPEIPSRGILVSLTGFLGDSFRPGRDVVFLGIAADYLPHPAAHRHIVQNSFHARRLHNAIFMPHWPHPNLVPRNATRRDRFENVCFFGDASNLAPELRDESWRLRLRSELGLDFLILDASRWHDYSEADCVVAVRGFGNSPFLHKPATKLYNAWLAGVPFMGGRDSAYLGDGKPGKNYLQASSPDELFTQIRRLKEDPSLREKLAANGRVAAEAFTPQAVLERWQALLGRTAPALAEKWQKKSRVGRRLFFLVQSASVFLDRKLRH